MSGRDIFMGALSRVGASIPEGTRAEFQFFEGEAALRLTSPPMNGERRVEIRRWQLWELEQRVDAIPNLTDEMKEEIESLRERL